MRCKYVYETAWLICILTTRVLSLYYNAVEDFEYIPSKSDVLLRHQTYVSYREHINGDPLSIHQR